MTARDTPKQQRYTAEQTYFELQAQSKQGDKLKDCVQKTKGSIYQRMF